MHSYIRISIQDIPFYLDKHSREVYMTAQDYEKLSGVSLEHRIKPMSFIVDFENHKLIHFKHVLHWARNECWELAEKLEKIGLTSRDESELEVENVLLLEEKQKLQKLVLNLKKRVADAEFHDSREKFLKDFLNVCERASIRKNEAAISSSDLARFSILRRKDALDFFGTPGKKVLNKKEILRIFRELDSKNLGIFDEFTGTFKIKKPPES